MKKIEIGKTKLKASNIVLGCMSMNKLSTKEATKVVDEALELGINFFDHADIYGSGESEKIFGKAIDLKSDIREDIFIQSKASIRKGYYDSSKKHILESVDGILKRLNTDYLDFFLLHRPDALIDPLEVRDAFDELEKTGKVKHFGVSNYNSMQIELLKKYISQDININQMQLSAAHTGMIDQGINVNTNHENAYMKDGSVLDYSRLHDITLQAWSPVRKDWKVFLNNSDFPLLNKKLKEVGKKYNIDSEATAIAWILTHPANLQVILGTMNLKRLKNYSKASEIKLSRKDWYDIYTSYGNPLP